MSRLVDFLRWKGGFSTRAAAIAATSRAEVDAALESGEIVWISHGRYGLPEIEEAVATAHGLNGVLSHASAALWHGWELKSVPEKTHVTFPRRRRVRSASQVHVHKSDLHLGEVVAGICTSVERTLLDCLRAMPADEALALADSALRHGVSTDVLSRVAATVRGRGRPGVLRAVEHADERSANPFESCLRSITLDVAGLDMTPQRLIVGSRQTVRPDLVDERRRLVLEADSFEWHGDRAALRRDARRYNLLVIDGWLVLRFAYEDVMFDRDYVLDVLRALVDARTQVGLCARCAA